ncbi:Holliday junction resolvase RuvX, partial [Lysobacter sp. 2RAB21]
VAVGSAFGHGARALAVIDVHGAGPDWNAIDRVYKEWRPDGLIVGDPMTLEGGDQPARLRAHAFARQLRARYKLPVVLVDVRARACDAAEGVAAGRAGGRGRG